MTSFVSYFSQKGFRQFCEIKEHPVQKLGNKSCSTLLLNLGIYFTRAFWACNKHFNKDLIEAFKALKCFKYMLPQKLIFFPKNASHIKDFVYQCGIGTFANTGDDIPFHFAGFC